MAQNEAARQSGMHIVVSTVPDVCITKCGAADVPVPYPLHATLEATIGTEPQILFAGKPAVTIKSLIRAAVGNEASHTGMKTGQPRTGDGKPIKGTLYIRANGHAIVHHGSGVALNWATPDGPGNTEGKILFVDVVQHASVGEDGTIYVFTSNEPAEENVAGTSPDGTGGEGTGEDKGSRTRGERSNENDALEGEDWYIDKEGYLCVDGERYGHPHGLRFSSEVIGAAPSPDEVISMDVVEAYDAARAAEREIAAAEAELHKLYVTTGLAVAGIFDPTPVSDAISLCVSLSDEDYYGAALDTVSMIPYVGDAVAKPLKAVVVTGKIAKAGAKLAVAQKKLAAAATLLGNKGAAGFLGIAGVVTAKLDTKALKKIGFSDTDLAELANPLTAKDKKRNIVRRVLGQDKKLSSKDRETFLKNMEDANFLPDDGVKVTKRVAGYQPAPKSLPAFPDAKPAKAKTHVQGGGKKRERWKDSDGNIYEWDSQHGAVEKYNRNGKHLGEFDHNTGAQTKGPDKTREVEP